MLRIKSSSVDSCCSCFCRCSSLLCYPCEPTWGFVSVYIYKQSRITCSISHFPWPFNPYPPIPHRLKSRISLEPCKITSQNRTENTEKRTCIPGFFLFQCPLKHQYWLTSCRSSKVFKVDKIILYYMCVREKQKRILKKTADRNSSSKQKKSSKIKGRENYWVW